MSSAPCSKCYTDAVKSAKESGWTGPLSVMCDCDEIATRQNLQRIQALHTQHPVIATNTFTYNGKKYKVVQKTKQTY